MKKMSLILLLIVMSCSQEDMPEKNDQQKKTVMVSDKYKKPSNDEIKSKLTEMQYYVTQKEGTERPFDNAYWDNKAAGIYVDIVSGEPLYSSTHKFKSGTGWPSFYRSIKEDAVKEKIDTKLFVKRVELRSVFADSHLGHLFNDGPAPTGMRHCINSASLKFIPKEKMEELGYKDYLYLFEKK